MTKAVSISCSSTTPSRPCCVHRRANLVENPCMHYPCYGAFGPKTWFTQIFECRCLKLHRTDFTDCCIWVCHLKKSPICGLSEGHHCTKTQEKADHFDSLPFKTTIISINVHTMHVFRRTSLPSYTVVIETLWSALHRPHEDWHTAAPQVINPSSSIISGRTLVKLKTKLNYSSKKFFTKMVSLILFASYQADVCPSVLFSDQFGFN